MLLNPLIPALQSLLGVHTSRVDNGIVQYVVVSPLLAQLGKVCHDAAEDVALIPVEISLLEEQADRDWLSRGDSVSARRPASLIRRQGHRGPCNRTPPGCSPTAAS